MTKRLGKLAMGIMLLLMCWSPSQVKASEIDKINKQLRELQLQERQAEQQRNTAEETITDTESGKKKTEKDLVLLGERIDKQMKELTVVMLNIDKIKIQLHDNAKQLEDVNERILKRSELLDDRIKLMYMNGQASYLEVLFDATSFTDFLGRLDSLETIASQDNALLKAHKQDKQLVLDKKKQIEDDLVQVKQWYAELDQRKNQLKKQEKEKQVLLASLDKKLETLHGLSESQDQILVGLFQERSKLQAKRLAVIESERKKRQASGEYKGGQLSPPLTDYTVTSTFGVRTDPITGQQGVSHSGIDMGAPRGTKIHAAESGVVISAEWWNGYGNTVVIDHGNGLWTLYGHIDYNGIKVAEGDEVQVGDTIALVGTTGNSTGYHLHFEVRLNGERVNPAPYLQ